MTRGRKPKPTELKLLQGNAGKRSTNKDEPKVDALKKVPVAPCWLSERGAEAWEHLAEWLVGSKILTATDLHNLEAFCSAYSRWRDAEEHYAKEGPVVEGATGGPVKNPAATVINESLKQMAMFGSALGLDPASRARLAVPGAEEENPFAALLGKKKG
ncbi:phage terminase small subunit P27 family [Marinobacterium lutimaris]|uniref:Phage terminase, small subunit, putative, P27 family n=1 Tax=Marinobacterium lutimaris TaxID=568106 RepID=A0A1H5Y9F4_9GAMM|nr:phage terminase small subunit P27 family [Marinobacterium lutimaris]SEG20651.1 phage terminase, small subunit, putative, P27 family [Marinobacterium lutimaris]